MARALMALGASVLTAGCSNSGPVVPDGYPNGPRSWAEFHKDSQERDTVGDWNDIDAAVDFGAAKVEMAILAHNTGPSLDGSPGDLTERVFKLKTVRDEPAWIWVTRSDRPLTALTLDPKELGITLGLTKLDDPEHPPTRLVIRAKVGRFGDRDQEKRLLKAVADRLSDLAGVGWKWVEE